MEVYRTHGWGIVWDWNPLAPNQVRRVDGYAFSVKILLGSEESPLSVDVRATGSSDEAPDESRRLAWELAETLGVAPPIGG